MAERLIQLTVDRGTVEASGVTADIRSLPITPI